MESKEYQKLAGEIKYFIYNLSINENHNADSIFSSLTKESHLKKLLNDISVNTSKELKEIFLEIEENDRIEGNSEMGNINELEKNSLFLLSFVAKAKGVDITNYEEVDELYALIGYNYESGALLQLLNIQSTSDLQEFLNKIQ